MAYAASGEDAPVDWQELGRQYSIFTVTETEASSAAEFQIAVPKVGEVTLVQWELTTPGSSATMRPTFRTATGAWDGSGANSNKDVNRIATAAAQGNEQASFKYYAPGGILYVRGGYDNAATDATGQMIITVATGHGS